MSNYRKGRAFEYEIAAILEREGYEVMRSAGSHGPFDLVAVKRNGRNVREIGLLQLKISEKGGMLPKADA